MIKTFKCKETERIWNGFESRQFPGDIQNRVLNKLRQLDASQTLDDLKKPPGNRLEPLKGVLMGRMSIRVNNQWRLCFVWKGAKVYDVVLMDYH